MSLSRAKARFDVDAYIERWSAVPDREAFGATPERVIGNGARHSLRDEQMMGD